MQPMALRKPSMSRLTMYLQIRQRPAARFSARLPHQTPSRLKLSDIRIPELLSNMAGQRNFQQVPWMLRWNVPDNRVRPPGFSDQNFQFQGNDGEALSLTRKSA